MLLNKGEKTRNNFFRILRSVWLEPGISRVELAERLKMDKATVSVLVNQMFEKKILSSAKKKEKAPRVGRRREGLGINLEFGCILGYEIQHDKITVTAVDLAYNRIASQYYSLKTDINNLHTNFMTVFNDFTGSKELKGLTPLGIGVAITGIIDSRQQSILRSKPLGSFHEEYDFHSKIVDKLSVPVYLGNDANCCASGILASARYRNKGYRNFLFLYFYYRDQGDRKVDPMRLGLGIGIVINENLYSGISNTAGEFRSLFWNDQHDSQLSLTAEEIQGIKDNGEMRKKMGREIAKNLSLLINVMNFKTLFIGGDVSYLPREMEKIFYEELNRNWPYEQVPSCDIKILEEDANLVSDSAGGMFLQHLFSDPERTEDLELKRLWWERILNC